METIVTSKESYLKMIPLSHSLGKLIEWKLKEGGILVPADLLQSFPLAGKTN